MNTFSSKFFTHIKTFIFFILFLVVNLPAFGSEINIQLAQKSYNNIITIAVTNKSTEVLQLAKIRLKIDSKTYWLQVLDKLQANQTKNYTFIIQYPKIKGSYAQIASIYYYNESKLFSLTDVGYFNYLLVRHFAENAKLKSKQAGKQSFLSLSAINNSVWTIVIPDEVNFKIINKSQGENFLLTGKYDGFNSNYPIFAIKEALVGQQHFSQIIHTVVAIKHAKFSGKSSYQRGKTPNLLLLAIILFSVVGFVFSSKKRVKYNPKNQLMFSQLLLLYSSRLFFLSIAYLVLKNADQWLSFSVFLSEHFSGKNYRYFFLYFVDFYYWAFVLLYLPYLKFIEKFRDVATDKYIAALKYLLGPLFLILLKFNWDKTNLLKKWKTSKSQLQSPLKTAWLLVAVKLFFLPLLASWVIGNFIHQYNLVQNFNWTFIKINAFILALLILIDTSIFLFGYMFESEKLGSKVKSVEPSILGWLVCLWCYPPFNSFSFTPFDIDLFTIHIPIELWAQSVVLSLITLLWGIFVWSSITLGFKASNLTNRGIVAKGPYRYCRHPAYTAKILVWLVEAVFLGKYFVGLFISFFIIYLLRAITEERHLSLDPDYLKYKKQVPYRFIPGLI